jgi:hypothetical protein
MPIFLREVTRGERHRNSEEGREGEGGGGVIVCPGCGEKKKALIAWTVKIQGQVMTVELCRRCDKAIEQGPSPRAQQVTDMLDEMYQLSKAPPSGAVN